MHFDPDRAHRLRAVLGATGQAPAEKKMFGWLSLLVRGNTCCGAASTSSAQADLATLPFDMRQGMSWWSPLSRVAPAGRPPNDLVRPRPLPHRTWQGLC